VNYEGRVARRMPGRRHRLDPGDDLRAGQEALRSLLDRVKAAASPDDENLAVVRRGRKRFLRTPEVPFCSGDVERRLREDHFVEIIDDAPDVIGMGVGEHDIGDLAGIDLRGLEALDQAARRGHEIRPRPRVEKDQAIRQTDEGQVAGRQQFTGLDESCSLQSLKVGLGDIGQNEVERQDQIAVADGRQRSGVGRRQCISHNGRCQRHGEPREQGSIECATADHWLCSHGLDGQDNGRYRHIFIRMN